MSRRILALFGISLALATVAWGQPADVSEVAVLATNSAHIKQGTDLLSGHLVVNESSPGPTLGCGGKELCIGPHASTPVGFDVVAESVHVKNGTLIQGSLYCLELLDQGDIPGLACQDVTFPAIADIPDFVPADLTGNPQDVTVGPGGLLVLGPGVYGDVTVAQDGGIVFSGGIYNVRSVLAEKGTALLFAGPSDVRVDEKFSQGQRSILGPEDGSGVLPSQIVFYVRGFNGETGGLDESPEAAVLGHRSTVEASFYVPNGTLRLLPDISATGGFLARDVMAGPRAQIAVDSFFVHRVLDVTKSGAGSGTVVSTPSGIQCDPTCSASFDNGSSVQLTASPSAGSLFVGWGGDCAAAGSSPTAVVSMTEDRTCDAQFEPAATILVRVTKAGSGDGTVVSDPVGIDCGSTCEYNFGTARDIFLEATANADSEFLGWSGDADCVDGLLAPNSDKSCIATFGLLPPPPPEVIVTVTLGGTGGGRVDSVPGGISCGQACSAPFPEGSRVELGPQADRDSQFVGFGGDRDCIDGFLFLVGTNGTVDCTAQFDLLPPPPPTFRLTIVPQGPGVGVVTSDPPGITCGGQCSADFVEQQGQSIVNLVARADPGSTFVGWGGSCFGASPFFTLVMTSDTTCTATFDIQQ